MCQRKACPGSKLLDLLVQTLLFYACCFTDKTGYYKSKLTSFTEDPGCHRLSLCMSFACRTAAKLGPCVSLPQTCCFYRRHTSATSAFCASEAVHRKVCWLTCCVRKDRRLNADLRFALVSELAHVPGPTDTYGPYCSRPPFQIRTVGRLGQSTKSSAMQSLFCL